jgi:chorismate mutase
VTSAVRALRGATTVELDTVEQVQSRTAALLIEMLERNGIEHDDIISVLFRGVGFGDIPLICARELDIVDATPLCIRVLMHLTTSRSRAELRHVYLEGASGLRDDLPE